MTDFDDFRELFGDVFANKNLGQNFLFNPEILREIVDAAKLSSDDKVLEIGPGLGTLTEEILSRKVDLQCVEYDENLASKLRENVSKIAKFYGDSADDFDSRLKITNDDFLDYDLENFAKKADQKYKIIANIPYNITKPIVAKILETKFPPQIAALLVQDEVAKKLAARPGDLSILAICAQVFADIEMGIFVSRNEFLPAPKVDSRVVIIRPRSEDLIKKFARGNGAKTDEEIAKLAHKFWQLVEAGFREKRKKIRTSLAPAFAKTKDETSEFLTESGVDSNLRAQDLSIETWLNLTAKINKGAKIC